jgi:hypothetical protein
LFDTGGTLMYLGVGLMNYLYFQVRITQFCIPSGRFEFQGQPDHHTLCFRFLNSQVLYRKYYFPDESELEKQDIRAELIQGLSSIPIMVRFVL